ncbi:putative endo-beta-1,4-glucanase D [Grifola frondosa]|uniref:lytic cellulose monooxygenase (C4-dehydrogenating) n=1 Tax=Grifola frondosa TaxID=5627 RepID=A0A1C7M8K6_GRIFR|nr:putative endo-beta-1,4-glucanase D [Grifola frondosa]
MDSLGPYEGPLMTYMALCETTCDQYDPTNATWFKIDEAGKKSDGNWTQYDLYEGKSYSITLPPKIPAGDYLIRHEIIALHAAIALYGAEFYPSCTQVHISGNDSGTFTPTGSIPGIYHDNDPGIEVDLYTNPKAAYSFPGPAIATFQEDGSSNSTSDNSTSSSTSSTSDSSTSPSTSSTPTSPTVPSSSADSSTTSATATPTTGAQASCTANRKRRIMRKSTFLS